MPTTAVEEVSPSDVFGVLLGQPPGAGPVKTRTGAIKMEQSSRTRHVLRMIEKLGKCRWPALLVGETGTGKEVVAREIHYVSNSHGPFVTIDCSSMVAPQMESELFGHMKGAFSGAAAAKIGLIEEANGGTAFFDDVEALPLDLQAKLLRALQEKEFRPLRIAHHTRVRLSCYCGHDSGSGCRSRKRNLSQGSVLPPKRHQYKTRSAARAEGGYPDSDQSLLGKGGEELHDYPGSAGSDFVL
jgi:hypothetical protein